MYLPNGYALHVKYLSRAHFTKRNNLDFFHFVSKIVCSNAYPFVKGIKARRTEIYFFGVYNICSFLELDAYLCSLRLSMGKNFVFYEGHTGEGLWHSSRMEKKRITDRTNLFRFTKS